MPDCLIMPASASGSMSFIIPRIALTIAGSAACLRREAIISGDMPARPPPRPPPPRPPSAASAPPPVPASDGAPVPGALLACPRAAMRSRSSGDMLSIILAAMRSWDTSICAWAAGWGEGGGAATGWAHGELESTRWRPASRAAPVRVQPGREGAVRQQRGEPPPAAATNLRARRRPRHGPHHRLQLLFRQALQHLGGALEHPGVAPQLRHHVGRHRRHASGQAGGRGSGGARGRKGS
jgi:hypothetical protein